MGEPATAAHAVQLSIARHAAHTFFGKDGSISVQDNIHELFWHEFVQARRWITMHSERRRGAVPGSAPQQNASRVAGKDTWLETALAPAATTAGGKGTSPRRVRWARPGASIRTSSLSSATSLMMCRSPRAALAHWRPRHRHCKTVEAMRKEQRILLLQRTATASCGALLFLFLGRGPISLFRTL